MKVFEGATFGNNGFDIFLKVGTFVPKDGSPMSTLHYKTVAMDPDPINAYILQEFLQNGKKREAHLC